MLSSHSSRVAVWPASLDGARVKLPHRIDHRMVMRVENVFAIFGVAGDVDLRHAVAGTLFTYVSRIETVILRGDVNIVHVQQNAAIGALHHFGQELPFGHFGGVKLGVAAHVFDRDRNLEEIAHVANFLQP